MLTEPQLIDLLRAQGLDTADQEQVWLICMDVANNLRGMEMVALGSANDCIVPIPTILRKVILSGGERFVLAHNHTTGDPTPSEQDRALDRDVTMAASYIGLHHTGHLIMAGDTWQWLE